MLIFIDGFGTSRQPSPEILESVDLYRHGHCHGHFIGATDMKKSAAVHSNKAGKIKPDRPLNVRTHWLKKQAEMTLPNDIGLFIVGVGGVQKTDRVMDLNAGDSWLTPHLDKIGARIISVNLLEMNEGVYTTEVKGRNAFESQPALDILFTTMVLSRLASPPKVLGEIKQMLKPGGRLVVTELEKHHDRELKTALHQHWMGFFPGDLRHWIAAAGFSNIIVSPVPNMYLPLNSLLPESKRSLRFIMATGTCR